MARKLSAGVSRYSRSKAYKLHGTFKRRYKTAAKKPETAPTTKTVPVKGAKNGKTRVVPTTRSPRYYPAEDVKAPKASRKTPKTGKLRSSITPGTVLVLLAGRFRGKRVVFLKQLTSGLLLVTGPYKCNGVPLKRVNQAYAIATSTHVDISGVKLNDKLTDCLFKKECEKKGKEFFSEEKAKKVVNAEKAKLQKEVDSQLLPLVKKTPFLNAYLGASFSLENGQAPHTMKF